MMASGPRPMTRAACTYSFSFSTMVEPRTVRAYCTQPAKPMDRISTGTTISSCRSPPSATRATPSMSSAIRIAGKESCTSAMRMMTASTRPPTYPASSPSETPKVIAKTTEARPMPSEMRAPYRIVDRMSRPWLSLPSGNARSPPSIHAGGLNAAFRSSAAASNGFCGATQGDSTAAPTQTSVSAAATTVTGDLRKLQARSWSQMLLKIKLRRRRGRSATRAGRRPCAPW